MVIWTKRLWRCLVAFGLLFREVLQIVYGMYRITRLPTPCVSIFGGSRLKGENQHIKQAELLAYKLVKAGLAVLTGGGPGIMEAANCGAMRANDSKTDMSMGIIIYGMKEEELMNKCVGDHIVLDYFFARKWLLINYSIGFCIFPGGLGTLDELADMLNLMQTGKLPIAPVVLIGKDFWKEYLAWISIARKGGYLSPTSEPKVLVTDDLNEVVETIRAFCKECKSHQRI